MMRAQSAALASVEARRAGRAVVSVLPPPFLLISLYTLLQGSGEGVGDGDGDGVR